MLIVIKIRLAVVGSKNWEGAVDFLGLNSAILLQLNLTLGMQPPWLIKPATKWWQLCK